MFIRAWIEAIGYHIHTWNLNYSYVSINKPKNYALNLGMMVIREIDIPMLSWINKAPIKKGKSTMIPLEVRLFTWMPLEVPNLLNDPYVQKITLYKVIIHSNLQALFTKDGRNGPELALFTKDLSV